MYCFVKSLEFCQKIGSKLGKYFKICLYLAGAMESDYPADEEMFKCEFDEPKTPTPQPSPKRKPIGEQGLW